MIAVESRGRLGNQMFQYAFGLAASTVLQTEFVMDESRLAEFFVLRGRERLRARVRRAAAFRLRRGLSPLPVVSYTGGEDPDEVMASLADDTAYAGCFQSERYFEGVSSDVRAAFSLDSAHQLAFSSRYPELGATPYVCCHVRGTDYRHFDGGVVLPMSYYRQCLANLDAYHGHPIVFVGDDLDEAAAAFSGERARFERNAEGVDLLLLIHAAAVVISNSSFGWWGAWLGERRDRPVYAPRHWLGFRRGYEVPRSIIPPRWTQITVEA